MKWRWVGDPPNAAERVCLFVTVASEGQIPDRAIEHARHWSDAGFNVIFVVASNNLDIDPAPAFGHVMVRENRGYDFGAWAAAIQALPWLRDSGLLVLTNDSVYGPGRGFSALLARVDDSKADVVGSTESRNQCWHFQSFLIFFRPGALRHPAFWEFWQRIRIGGRQHAIDCYELRLAETLRRAGLKVEALFPARSRGNPTFIRWKELLQEGFPFVKRRLLQALDQESWLGTLQEHGFDLDIIERDLRGNGCNANPAKRSQSA